MKFYKKLIFVLVASTNFCFGQMTTFRFTYDLGAFDITGGMVQTPAGEFVIAGLNNSFGPYYGNAMKIDAQGTVVWCKSYTASFATNFADIKNVSTGGFIMAGQSTSGGGGAVLVRLDNNGNVTWAFRYQLPNHPTQNASSEFATSVIETSDGGFLVGGGVDHFWDGSSPNTVDTTSALGFKVNSTGGLVWSRVWTITTANPDEHYINDVAESSDGYFFVGISSEGAGTLNSDGDYPRNTLLIKTDKTTGALTYIRRWGVGNTTSQGINAALRLANGNILLGGYDDVHGFLISITGTGSGAPSVIFNRRLNGSVFGTIYVVQDIMENADGNYSLIGTSINPFSIPVALNTIIVKINSSTNALIFGRSYAPIGLSAILPEGGLASDQGYYVSMTDQQSTGFNYNIIRTNPNGQTNDPSSGCPGTAITPALGTISVTLTTPTSNNYNMLTSATFTPVVNNMTPVRTQHCLNIPSVLSASASSTNATCNGQCNGTGSATPTGGTPPYTYLWSPGGQTTQNVTGLCAGTYTVTITDAGPSTATATITVTQPSVLNSSISGSTMVTCNGGTNGSATVSASGGTPGYTYAWSPSGGTAATATGLGAGTYTVTTTDANGCTRTTTITITQPTAITVGTNSTQSGCSTPTGTATATPSGGNPGYTYAWAPGGQTTTTATGLAAGTYTVTVTDASGCTQTATVTVSAAGAPTVTLSSQTNVACFGGSTGSATASATGGTSPYTYAWSPSGGTNATATGLAAGNYTVTVTDANGCSATQTVTINQPASALSATTSSTQTGCASSIGTATANPSGGSPGYTYSWSPSSQTTQTATGLAVGIYTVTITDANGCTLTQTANVTAANGPVATLAASNDPSCNGGSDGNASISVSGGTSPYTYSWSPTGGTNANATGLSAGTYTVIVTDANGCTVAQTVTLSQPAAITVGTSSTNAGCTSATGTATATPTGGTPGYTYLWSAGAQTTQTATGLATGSYTVTITDANGCTATQTVTVSSNNPVTLTATGTAAGCTVANGTATASPANGASPYTYAWNNGQTTATATGLATGTYTVTVTDANGCSQTTTVTINQTAGPTAGVTATTTIITSGGNSQLTATGGGTYLWTPATGLSCVTCANPVASPAQTTTYCVTVTDGNGCTDSTCITITGDIPCGKIFVTNACSPNNDGQNDFECVMGNCIRTLFFAIYDRWGEKVFETSDPGICWDGTYKGRAIDPAVFVYHLEATLTSGEVVSQKGNITLVK